jgi:N-acetylneuraminic acid mutarotase
MPFNVETMTIVSPLLRQRLLFFSMLCSMLFVMACPGQTPQSDLSDGGENNQEADNVDGGAVSGQWQELLPLPTPRQETAVVAVDEQIYVIGGYDDNLVMQDRVDRYDVALNTWSAAPNLPWPLHHANAAVSRGVIYVAGFLVDNFDADGRVFALTPGDGAWSIVGFLPAGTDRGAGAAVAMDKIIYIVGGYRAAGAVGIFSAYDTLANTWTILPSLPVALDHLVAGVIEGKIYVAGGRSGSIGSHVPRSFAFDPEVGTWEERAAMPTSRAGIAGAVIYDRLYVFGGEGAAEVPSGVFDDVERYDPATDTWEILAPMALPRHGMGAVGLADSAYIPGGADVQAFAAIAHFDRFVAPP